MGDWRLMFPGVAVGKHLDGDTELAGSYQAVANSMMFSIKTMMKNGGLTSFGLSTEMPDGTTIDVRSDFGNDQVFISSPSVIPVEEVAGKELMFKLVDQDGAIISQRSGVSVAFSIIRQNSDLTFSTEYPRQLYDEVTGYWTLRERNVNPSPTPWDPGYPEPPENLAWELADQGNMYEPDDEFWVHYDVQYYNDISPSYKPETARAATTEYRGRTNQAEFDQNINMIRPDSYQDVVTMIPTPIIVVPPDSTWKFRITASGYTAIIPGLYPLAAFFDNTLAPWRDSAVSLTWEDSRWVFTLMFNPVTAPILPFYVSGGRGQVGRTLVTLPDLGSSGGIGDVSASLDYAFFDTTTYPDESMTPTTNLSYVRREFLYPPPGAAALPSYPAQIENARAVLYFYRWYPVAGPPLYPGWWVTAGDYSFY